MMNQYSFRWEGNSDPSVESGDAIFTFAGHVVRADMDNFATAHKLHRLIEMLVEHTEETTTKKVTDRIEDLARRIGRGEL